ncbi:uncharacterized protein cd5 [Poecilia reticulata]|uniref:uncharacterized protein cd5 n=1 Tax=Poecilia reticulata TaxID=8081 RepID=UPI0004A37D88|nr:PREDICTED: uncharacterized protein LOC103470406 [Poecilia reticulata]
MMDLSAVVIIVALSLVSAVSSQDNSSTISPNTSTVCSCASAAPTSKPDSLSITVGILNVIWTETCAGTVQLVLYHSFNNTSLNVSYSSKQHVSEILQNVCKDRKGCEYEPIWLHPGTEAEKCYMIHANGANETSDCKTIRVECKVEKLPDFEGQLTACKVVIALLSIVLLVLLLMRFTKPTVMALQKRLSDRRQHRWVGPTQSHSVSYHRGKSVAKNEDEEKRFSALERLTVGGGSSPSCNRNSYNY